MSMFTEIAVEGTVSTFVQFVRTELEKETDPAARDALKRVGRYALSQLEWPCDWAKPYEAVFRDA